MARLEEVDNAKLLSFSSFLFCLPFSVCLSSLSLSFFLLQKEKSTHTIEIKQNVANKKQLLIEPDRKRGILINYEKTIK